MGTGEIFYTIDESPGKGLDKSSPYDRYFLKIGLKIIIRGFYYLIRSFWKSRGAAPPPSKPAFNC